MLPAGERLGVGLAVCVASLLCEGAWGEHSRLAGQKDLSSSVSLGFSSFSSSLFQFFLWPYSIACFSSVFFFNDWMLAGERETLAYSWKVLVRSE